MAVITILIQTQEEGFPKEDTYEQRLKSCFTASHWWKMQKMLGFESDCIGSHTPSGPVFSFPHLPIRDSGNTNSWIAVRIEIVRKRDLWCPTGSKHTT